MAVPPYVTSGTTIDSTWGNQVADAVVNVFASTAARSSAITSPTAGMATCITSNDTDEGLYVYNSDGEWQPPWNMAWGLLPVTAGGTSGRSYAVATTPQGSITTGSDLTGMTVTVDGIPGRLLEATATVDVTTTNADDVAQIQVLVDGTAIATDAKNAKEAGTGGDRFLHITVPFELTSGSHTVKVRASVASGAGTLTAQGSSVAPITFVVKDIGPVDGPA